MSVGDERGQVSGLVGLAAESFGPPAVFLVGSVEERGVGVEVVDEALEAGGPLVGPGDDTGGPGGPLPRRDGRGTVVDAADRRTGQPCGDVAAA